MLKIRLYYRSPRVMKLEVGLHHECLGSDQEVFRSTEASNGASAWKS